MDCLGRVGKELPTHQPTSDTIFYKNVLVIFSVVDPTHCGGSDSSISDPEHHCDPDTLMRIRPTVTDPTYLLFFLVVSDPTHCCGSDSFASGPAHNCDPDTLMRIRPAVTEPTYLLFFFYCLGSGSGFSRLLQTTDADPVHWVGTGY